MAAASSVDVLWSPKRGVGASTLAAAAAVRHAGAGESVAVLDLADGDGSALVSLLSETPRDPFDSSRSSPVRIEVDSDAAGAPIAVYAPGTDYPQHRSHLPTLLSASAEGCDRLIIDAGTDAHQLLGTLSTVLPDASASCTLVLANCYLAAQAAAAAFASARSSDRGGLGRLGYDRPIIVSQPDRHYTATDLASHLQQITGEACSPTVVARSRHVAAAIDSASITQRLPRSLQRFETSPHNPPPYQDPAAELSVEQEALTR